MEPTRVGGWGLRVMRLFSECHKIRSIELTQMRKEQFLQQPMIISNHKHKQPRLGERKLLKDV